MVVEKYGMVIDEYKPELAIVIPAYNAEKFLPRCINCALFQKEVRVEVIVVIDEGTTDSSVEIVKKYTENFPGKVFCIVKDGKGLSPARQTGMENTRAPYVVFVDVDDYIDQALGMECLKLAYENDADMVGYNFAEYKTYKNRLIDYKAAKTITSQSVVDSIEEGGIGWWKFVFSVKFLRENANFHDMLWEDASEIPTLISKTNKFAVTGKVLYYKINNEESMTETFPKISRRFVEHTLANTMTLENVNKKYYSAACYRTAKRMIFPFFKFYSYYDHLVEYMKEHEWVYSFKKDVWERLTPFERNFVEKILATPEPCIPLDIYINGFGTDIEKYKMEAEKGFWNWENLYVLDEKSCDVTENDYIFEQYKKGNTDIVAGYFAVKKIYENGGIYIGRKLKLNSTLNSMRYHNSFFGFETETKITGEVFGGRKQDCVFEEILKTFEYNELFASCDSISARIRTVLVGKCGIKLTGREQKGLFGSYIYPAMVFAINANGQCKNISYIVEDEGEVLSISSKVFEHCIDYQMQNAEFLKSEVAKYKKQLEDAKKANPNVAKVIVKDPLSTEKEDEYLLIIRNKEQEIVDLKNSFTYKFGYYATWLPRKLYRLLFKRKNRGV